MTEPVSRDMIEKADWIVNHHLENSPDLTLHSKGRCHLGYDYYWQIACGEAHGVVFLAAGHPASILEQLDQITPSLRRKEAHRVTEDEIVQNSMARFYV